MKRVVARLDIKNNTVIKGIHLEGLRKVGDPLDLVRKYYECGIHEIYLNDAVASLYNRNNLFSILEQICRRIFVPICIGGGIRSLHDVEQALLAGADKVAVNTALIKNPDLINQISRQYGSQCLVGSIEAKRAGDKWVCYYDCGREATERNVLDWAEEMVDRGIGELLVTSIDKEGTKKGFDLQLLSAVCNRVHVPVIASGGCGTLDHLREVFGIEGLQAAAVASVLHYGILDASELVRLS